MDFQVDVTIKVTKGERVIELSLCEAQKMFAELQNLFQKDDVKYPLYPEQPIIRYGTITSSTLPTGTKVEFNGLDKE